MLASKNTNPPVRTIEQGNHWLGVLAGELNVRLREAREIAPGLWPKTLVLSHRMLLSLLVRFLRSINKQKIGYTADLFR